MNSPVKTAIFLRIFAPFFSDLNFEITLDWVCLPARGLFHQSNQSSSSWKAVGVASKGSNRKCIPVVVGILLFYHTGDLISSTFIFPAAKYAFQRPRTRFCGGSTICLHDNGLPAPQTPKRSAEGFQSEIFCSNLELGITSNCKGSNRPEKQAKLIVSHAVSAR